MMADSREIVRWSLERRCPFRTADKWFLPEETANNLRDLKLVAHAKDSGEIVDGICIYGCSLYCGDLEDPDPIPVDGFHIEERLGPFGGLEQAIETCGSCEANVKGDAATGVAGCVGHLYYNPDSPELEERLWAAIERLVLEKRLRSAFEITRPLWFGFWIHSPLGPVQAEVLYELLGAIRRPDSPADCLLDRFLNALQAVIEWNLPLHVELMPLGHSDLGWHTVFPHCPRCKANAPFERWQTSYPTEPHRCHACGHEFIPNDNRSSTSFKYHSEADDLKRLLGEKGHDELTRRFLHLKGRTPAQIDSILDKYHQRPLLREIAILRDKRKKTLRDLRSKRKSYPQADVPSNISVPLSDKVALDLVLVPAGEFWMGSLPTEPGHSACESPRHKVTIARPYYMGRFPVTQAQWLAVMGRNPSHCKGRPDLPVDTVSWFDCQEFFEQLCDRFKRVFRLPSEAEWEYACRAGTTTAYAFGDDLAADAANFTPLSDFTFAIKLQKKTTPVGTFPPNAWGIFDMHGNLDEWVEDVWHPNYESAPSDGSTWLDDDHQETMGVVRGGYARASELVCRSARRQSLRVDAGRSKTEVKEGGAVANLHEAFFYPVSFRVVCEVET